MKPAAKPRTPRRSEPAKARPVTPAYLRNAAMHYLSQRAASVAMLRQTLDRRAKRRLCVKVIDAETRVMIETAITELTAHGLVDDARFAEVRATTLAGRGLSKRRITAGLAVKGIDRATIATTAAADVDELAQARRYMARKRLGRFRRDGATPDTKRKDLGALARAGFSFAIATRVLGECDDQGDVH